LISKTTAQSEKDKQQLVEKYNAKLKEEIDEKT